MIIMTNITTVIIVIIQIKVLPEYSFAITVKPLGGLVAPEPQGHEALAGAVHHGFGQVHSARVTAPLPSYILFYYGCISNISSIYMLDQCFVYIDSIHRTCVWCISVYIYVLHVI